MAFHIDVTLEDTRIIVTSINGETASMLLYDNLSGQNQSLHLPYASALAVVQLALAGDECPSWDDIRSVAESALVDVVSRELRPIP